MKVANKNTNKIGSEYAFFFFSDYVGKHPDEAAHWGISEAEFYLAPSRADFIVNFNSNYPSFLIVFSDSVAEE